MKKNWKVITATLLAMALVAGCGSDDGPEGGASNIVGGNNNNGNNSRTDGGASDGGATDAGDVTTPDASDATDGTDGDTPDDAGDAADSDGSDGGDTPTTCPETPCAVGELCMDGSCVEATAENKCQLAEDLGTLTTSNTLTATGSFLGESDVLAASCSGDTGPEKIFKFTVAEDSLVQFQETWVGQADGKIEFRSTCTQQASQQRCYDAGSSLFVPANTDVWMVVEQDVGRSSDFTIELSASGESCPLGQSVCTNGEMEICTGGNQSQVFACADSCADGSACLGDFCDQAIDVTATATFTGDLKAYTNSIDFDGETFCALGDGSTVPTPGREVVFRFPNLVQGQTINIDAQTGDSNVNAVFILNGCGANPYQCVDVFVSPEKGDWVAPADGTYYVVVDKLTSGGETFQYSFEYK
ncbi:hypothetical protein FIV42_04330 [Persicimonas caeni]|uniref:Peptidase C-terminal archaeal/bacterial domain-containing protein n=1 Tax=Persicimonas caeni TaxID=2292766 RepID=A0A4Y6PP61_PERCE|nr:hypothetical protein [Persicimonas caeni]QDG49993.1 hypothetical protein FIV42_04330 [Persicimonas caeni]QED31214.1 hypothetical protein FRD00_04325 [Persicimonas caeni]